ncbi:MAG TPA: DUF493 family protein [Spirochaetota bacterium]|jgi:putative lipoic acid-binding regulatory protein|nr:DUF493 family protein [Spirochaetota bacterium]OQA97687.1 MAG: hypothetical protein BWY23_01444 [Spirochaetes bacterium ADurb.Bin218]HOK03333.1 DUF493 family protein [Spirochaetota bacterium]HOK93293.1 DUF493 family protein [Spirochaetota bacterium]HON15130.1 DUF493 family protein [Spirochaetota bacterium]
MIQSGMQKKEIQYPSEIIFKSIFRNKPYTIDSIRTILSENSIEQGNVSAKESSGGKFISYTISGIFYSEENLNSICNQISMLEGFMAIF